MVRSLLKVEPSKQKYTQYNPPHIVGQLFVDLVTMRKSLFIFIFCTFLYSDNDLIFLPDSGIRVDSCGISKVLVDPNGVYFLYYTQGPSNGVAVSNDGLNFTIEDPQNYPSFRSNFMPDSSYKHYFIDIVNDTALLKSRSSIDGFTFSLDFGNRFVFPTNDAITSTNVYSTFFNNIFSCCSCR